MTDQQNMCALHSAYTIIQALQYTDAEEEDRGRQNAGSGFGDLEDGPKVASKNARSSILQHRRLAYDERFTNVRKAFKAIEDDETHILSHEELKELALDGLWRDIRAHGESFERMTNEQLARELMLPPHADVGEGLGQAVEDAEEALRAGDRKMKRKLEEKATADARVKAALDARDKVQQEVNGVQAELTDAMAEKTRVDRLAHLKRVADSVVSLARKK